MFWFSHMSMHSTYLLPPFYTLLNALETLVYSYSQTWMKYNIVPTLTNKLQAAESRNPSTKLQKFGHGDDE
ncbi:hypothetical protein LR48_Vigan01g180400 [Vigna angularis]|uniref:Uncharacterized protein n=1 Tax=Phaseolus angularis TaxID=3914 RepID=A0A0L9TNT8_PHAAN|nr:hypothetical protein LR48_Vigan01g180400 [Vigna angularis]